MVRARPGRLAPVPWNLTGGGTEAPRSMVAEGHFRRKREAPLTVATSSEVAISYTISEDVAEASSPCG